MVGNDALAEKLKNIELEVSSQKTELMRVKELLDSGTKVDDILSDQKLRNALLNSDERAITLALGDKTNAGRMKDFAREVEQKTLDFIKGKEYNENKSSNKRMILLEKIDNQKLKNVVGQLYREGSSIGDGGLADAVRHEMNTGELVGGKSHFKKAKERIQNLKNVIRKQELTDKELSIANELLDELIDALGGKE